MSDKMISDEKIYHLYNKTKNLKSSTDLDNLILEKIRGLKEEPEPPSSEKPWIYLPVAANILLAVFYNLTVKVTTITCRRRLLK